MNVLMFETPPVSVSRLVRAVLRVDGFRVSNSQDVEDAILKLNTSLFDVACVGPSGAPTSLLNHLETELPHLPVVLAGTKSEIKLKGQVTAILPAPLSVKSLTTAFRAVRRRRTERIEGLPVEVMDANVSIACRLAELTSENMVLAGESEEFHRYFGAAGMKMMARVWSTEVIGMVEATETDLSRQVRRVNVNLEGSGGRNVLLKLLKE